MAAQVCAEDGRCIKPVPPDALTRHASLAHETTCKPVTAGRHTLAIPKRRRWLGTMV